MSDFIPLPEGVTRNNAGTTCDMLVGPCACGAWHDIPEITNLREQLRLAEAVATACNGLIEELMQMRAENRPGDWTCDESITVSAVEQARAALAAFEAGKPAGEMP